MKNIFGDHNKNEIWNYLQNENVTGLKELQFNVYHIYILLKLRWYRYTLILLYHLLLINFLLHNCLATCRKPQTLHTTNSGTYLLTVANASMLQQAWSKTITDHCMEATCTKKASAPELLEMSWIWCWTLTTYQWHVDVKQILCQKLGSIATTSCEWILHSTIFSQWAHHHF